MERQESSAESGAAGLRDPREWHRGYPGRKLAGVCASVAENLRVSVSAVRAVFLLLLLAHGLGAWLYGVLWLVMPERPGGPSALDGLLARLRALVSGSRTQELDPK